MEVYGWKTGGMGTLGIDSFDPTGFYGWFAAADGPSIWGFYDSLMWGQNAPTPPFPSGRREHFLDGAGGNTISMG